MGFTKNFFPATKESERHPKIFHRSLKWVKKINKSADENTRLVADRSESDASELRGLSVQENDPAPANDLNRSEPQIPNPTHPRGPATLHTSPAAYPADLRKEVGQYFPNASPLVNGENDNWMRLFLRKRKKKNVPLLHSSSVGFESRQMRSSKAASFGSR